MKKLNTKGFSLLEGLIVLVVISAVVGLGFYAKNRMDNKSSSAESSQASDEGDYLDPEVSKLVKKQAEQISVTDSQSRNLSINAKKSIDQESRRETSGQVVPEGRNCTGDRGTSGKRVELIYLTSKSNDNYAKDSEIIRRNALGADVIFNNSAEKTGGKRKIRWTRNNECKIVVRKVVSNDQKLWNSINSYDAVKFGFPPRLINQALRDAGYSKKDRKYIVHVNSVETEVEHCGYGSPLVNDDRPGQDNKNNRRSYVNVYKRCWDHGNSSAYPAHSTWLAPYNNSAYLAGIVARSLGGPQSTAPNAVFYVPNNGATKQFSGGLNDYYGIGSYYLTSDSASVGDGIYAPVRDQAACSSGVGQNNGLNPNDDLFRANSFLLDCNNDDYFNTNPKPGSYLARKWNIANSPYLFTPRN